MSPGFAWLVGRLMAVSRSSLPGLMVIGTLVELNKPIEVGRLLLCGFQTWFPRLCLDAGCPVLFLNWGSDNTVWVWKFYNGIWKMECLCAALEVRSDSARDVVGAPNVGFALCKVCCWISTTQWYRSGAPNVELPKSTIAGAHQDDSGLSSPSVELPKSAIATLPQDVGSSPPNIKLPKSANRPNAELPKSTIASPPQDDVSSGEFKRNPWYIEEGELLREWLDISKGVLERGNDQKMVSVWKQITKYYEDNCKGGVVRTWNELT